MVIADGKEPIARRSQKRELREKRKGLATLPIMRTEPV